MTNKRQDIVYIAATLMHSQGYEGTKLADILDAAQIGKGQFYHYFSSKHELGLAVLDYFFESWSQRLLVKILSSEKDAETKIGEMLDWVIGQQRRNEGRCGCVFGNLAVEMSEHDEAFRRKLEFVFDSWVGKVKQVLCELVAPAEIEPEEANKMAQTIVAMIEGGILLMKSKQDVRVLTDIAEQIKFMIKSYVQSKASASV